MDEAEEAFELRSILQGPRNEMFIYKEGVLDQVKGPGV